MKDQIELKKTDLAWLRDEIGVKHDGCRRNIQDCTCYTAKMWRKLDAAHQAAKEEPLGGVVNREAYHKLIVEDVRWLHAKASPSQHLEADHIEQVLTSSIDIYHGIQVVGTSPSQRRERQSRMDRLTLALAEDICSSISEGGQSYDECTDDEQAGFRRAAHDILIRGIGKYFFIGSKGD